MKEYFHNYYLENIDKHRERSRKWMKNERKNNPIFRLNNSMSSVMTSSLKRGKENKHWEELINYSLIILKEHLEKQFQEGMSWNNYGRGGWNIDHIIPISWWEYEKPEDSEFKKCWALANLQPMWEKENFIKNNKLAYKIG